LGWIQALSFIVAGLLTLAFAIGVRRTLRSQQSSTGGPLLIGLHAVALIAAGVFVTDPAAGYPSGTPPKIENASLAGVLHNLAAGIGFPAIMAACLVFARWFAARTEQGWAFYSATSGVVVLIAVILANYGFPRIGGLADFSGLFQRISVVCGWTWLTSFAIYLLFLRSLRPTS